jgi:hypothetical protein
MSPGQCATAAMPRGSRYGARRLAAAGSISSTSTPLRRPQATSSRIFAACSAVRAMRRLPERT